MWVAISAFAASVLIVMIGKNVCVFSASDGSAYNACMFDGCVGLRWVKMHALHKLAEELIGPAVVYASGSEVSSKSMKQNQARSGEARARRTSASAPPGRNLEWWFLHIPKTGGSAMERTLGLHDRKRMYSLANCSLKHTPLQWSRFWVVPPGGDETFEGVAEERLWSGDEKRIDKNQLQSGFDEVAKNLGPSSGKRFFSPPVDASVHFGRMYTLFRHPFDRAISQYRFACMVKPLQISGLVPSAAAWSSRAFQLKQHRIRRRTMNASSSMTDKEASLKWNVLTKECVENTQQMNEYIRAAAVQLGSAQKKYANQYEADCHWVPQHVFARPFLRPRRWGEKSIPDASYIFCSVGELKEFASSLGKRDGFLGRWPNSSAVNVDRLHELPEHNKNSPLSLQTRQILLRVYAQDFTFCNFSATIA